MNFVRTKLLICICIYIYICACVSHCAEESLPFKQKIDNKTTVPLHHYLSKSERLIFFGSNDNDPTYEIVEPDSPSLSFKRKIRSIRSIRSLNSTKFGTSSDNRLPYEIHVNFRAFGEYFKLRLRRNSRLLSPTFKLHEEFLDKEVVDDGVSVSSNCFYHGYSLTHPNSSAAISMCGGMRGIIEASKATFVINPLPKRVINRSNIIGNSTHSHPHIILKKESLTDYECPHGRKRLLLTPEELHFETFNETFFESKRHTFRHRRSTKENELSNSSSFAKPNLDVNLTVETAVFIDEQLYYIMKKTFPSDTEQQIVTYVLTIMNAVQLLFKQPSLGRDVEISVVLMDILKQQPKDLASSDNIDTYLTNFCVWQHNKRLHSRGLTPRWDHALLLSGINMYVVDGHGRKKRHVVGLAPVSGMCNTLNSCTISEGMSFQTVLVAGHEMGHSLGMEHDGSQDGNSCDHDNYIMSPTLGAGKTLWSSCSRDYLERFIRTPQANCILSPSNHVNIINQFIANDKLPGQLFDADQQCMLRFGSDSRRSSVQTLDDICRLLRCDTGSARNIVSYHAHPALEGTNCGYKMWCREGRCVSQDISAQSSSQYEEVSTAESVLLNNTIIDGQWNQWAPFSICSSDCVTRPSNQPMGVMISLRKCDNPRPNNGGKYCIGNDKRVRICDASRICSVKAIISVDEYISDTCRAAARRNSNLEPRGTQYPSYDSSHSCYIWCNKRESGYLTQGWKLPDGTPCGHEKSRFNNRYCVNGECRFFDCNGNNVEEETNEKCAPNSFLDFGAYHDENWGPWMPISKCRYSCLVKSKGFRLVNRECNSISNCIGRKETFQLCSDLNDYCDSNSIRTAEDYANEICQKYRNKYPTLLSGRGRQHLTRSSNRDSRCIVACEDRVWHDIHYQMDAFNDGKFPFGTDCSTTNDERSYCLDGRCIKFDANDVPLDDDISDRNRVRQLFSREYRFLNRHRRSERNAFRTSGIQTNEDIYSEIASWERLNRLTPVQWRPPNPARPIRLTNSGDRNQTLRVEPYVWGMTLTECSKPCGGGVRNVNVYCHAGRYVVSDTYCNQLTKPINIGFEKCNTQPCIGRWKTEEWSSCSSTCGRGFKTRHVLCIHQTQESNVLAIIENSNCGIENRPKQLQMCDLPHC